MSSLVSRKFAEWTEGLDPHGSRISVFEHIRDIPYSLDIPRAGPGMATGAAPRRWGGVPAAPNTTSLQRCSDRLDLDVVYATFAFSWNDPDLRYPPPLREVAAHVPVSHHLACRVRIGRRWVLVDATWDPPLAKGGFPVNLNWDGLRRYYMCGKTAPVALCSPLPRCSHRDRTGPGKRRSSAHSMASRSTGTRQTGGAPFGDAGAGYSPVSGTLHRPFTGNSTDGWRRSGRHPATVPSFIPGSQCIIQ